MITVNLGRPVEHWFGECWPLSPDPEILVDDRLPRVLQHMVALHEIAHVRARTYQHGPRFLQALRKLWAAELGRGAEGVWWLRSGCGEAELLAAQLVSVGLLLLWRREGKLEIKYVQG